MNSLYDSKVYGTMTPNGVIPISVTCGFCSDKIVVAGQSRTINGKYHCGCLAGKGRSLENRRVEAAERQAAALEKLAASLVRTEL